MLFQVLGDILESIIGAIFVDSDMNLEVVWEVYTRLFKIEEINEVIRKKPQHPVKELMEKFPKNVRFNMPEVKDGKVSIVVEIGLNEGLSHKKLKFKGLGINKIGAKYAAAKCALREFEKRVYREMM